MASQQEETNETAKQPASRLGSRPSSAGAQYRDSDLDTIENVCTTSIYHALSGLLTSGKFSDMTVLCGGRTFKVHRAIVCTQSPFFDKAITGGFAESTTNVVELPDDDPYIFERFLQFLYTGNYNDESSTAWSKQTEVSMMAVDEVDELLKENPGVAIPGMPGTPRLENVMPSLPPRENAGTTGATAPPPSEEGGNDNDDAGDGSYLPEGEEEENNDDNDTEDGSYWPEEDSNGDIVDPEEPEEEYNEFGAQSSEANVSEGGGQNTNQQEDKHESEDEKVFNHRQDHLRSGKDLFLSLRVYVMADKFGVPTLKLLARDRFYRAAELSWTKCERFPEVVDELYTTTPETDVAMREIVCRLVGFNIMDDEQRARMEPVMRKHGDFAVGAMNYFLQSMRTVWV
ncbi:hypothetical protein VTH82DRAFT_7119 [Thermothelomyces myriococcoides]